MKPVIVSPIIPRPWDTRQARKDIELLNELGYDKLHVIVAKTPNSLSDDPKALGRPRDFDIDVDRLFLSAGAGFVVAICGEIMLMPGSFPISFRRCLLLDEIGKSPLEKRLHIILRKNA